MNDETYEALKRLISFVEIERDDMKWAVDDPLRVDIDMVNGWIDETAKEHQEEEYISKELEKDNKRKKDIIKRKMIFRGTDEILNLVDNRDELTRSDLQGVAQAIVTNLINF